MAKKSRLSASDMVRMLQDLPEDQSYGESNSELKSATEDEELGLKRSDSDSDNDFVPEMDFSSDFSSESEDVSSNDEITNSRNDSNTNNNNSAGQRRNNTTRRVRRTLNSKYTTTFKWKHRKWNLFWV